MGRLRHSRVLDRSFCEAFDCAVVGVPEQHRVDMYFEGRFTVYLLRVCLRPLFRVNHQAKLSCCL